MKRYLIVVMMTVCGVTLWPTTGAAQTVNIESMAKDQPGFGLSLAGSLSLSRGNTDQTVVGAGLYTQYETRYEDEDPEDTIPPFLRQRVLLSGSFSHQAANDERITSRRFAHTRWTAMWLRRLGSEVFAQYQYSEFARLTARILVGAGGRVVLVQHENFKAELGSAYMIEFEQLLARQGQSTPDPTVAHRWTNLLTFEIALFDDVLKIVNTVYAQPRLDDFSDYRLLDEFALNIAVTEVLSLGSALKVAYDSRPPTDVEATDITFAQTVKLSF